MRGRATVDLERLVGDAVLVEHEREGAEGRGLDRVDADREELVVHLRDEVGAGEDELLVAALERLAAEVVGAEVVALHPGAERAVEDEHPLAQRVEEVDHEPSRVPEPDVGSVKDWTGRRRRLRLDERPAP